MALRWSSDFTIAEFRNLKAKSIALDNRGNLLILPGKHQLGIKHLNRPIDEIVTFPRLSKNEPGAVQWSPHHENLFALSSDIKVELLSWKNDSDLCADNFLKAHTRVVTDINWHPVDPNIIASSSLDTFTYIWDLRECHKPVISLSSFSAVSHVKWNGTSRHLLATTHNGDVKIWDRRKASSPILYISAHLTSIHSFDWDPEKENKLFTASQDGTIKFFDISRPRKTECIINADAPVWKASYTPFGRGMLAVIIPPSKKSDNTLLLWNLTNSSVPLHTFVGHTETVLDFQWRCYRQNDFEHQLITWSKDQTLRIWEVDKYLQELCRLPNNDYGSDCVDGVSIKPKSESSLTDIGAENQLVSDTEKKIQNVESDDVTDGEADTSRKTIRNVPADLKATNTSSHSIETTNAKNSTAAACSVPANLQQEFSKNINIPNVQVQKTDIVRRMCSAVAKCNGHTVCLQINFPPSYPRNKAPIFQFDQGTTVLHSVRLKILEALRDTTDVKVRSNQGCLEACLRTLISTMQKLTSADADKINLFNKDRPLSDRISPFSNTHDAYFLPARTCGARFCHTGALVCFAKPLSQVLSTDKNICGLVSLSGRQTEALTRLYLQNKNGTLPPRTKYMIRRGLLKRMKNTHKNKRTVIVYDVSRLFLFNYELANKYLISGNEIASICKHNANVVNTTGRKDLQQIWNLTLLIASKISGDCDSSKNHHHFVKNILKSVIEYYISQSDVQTAATICCVFHKYLNVDRSVQSVCPSISHTHNASPYHTIHPMESSLESGWSFPIQKHLRSNSCSELLEDFRKCYVDYGEIADTNESSVQQPSNSPLKDDCDELLYDRVKRAYADVLYRWNLLNVRAMVMKCVKTAKVDTHKGIELRAECKKCRSSSGDKMCPTCKLPSLYCVICRLSVKGLANVCIYCGHGGHLFHMKRWYEKQNFCPAGCDCRCSMTLYSTPNRLK